MIRELVSSEAERLDRFLLGKLAGFSRARIRQLLAEGAVRVNGKIARTGVRLSAGDRVIINVGEIGRAPLADPTLALDVVLDTPGLLGVNKPAGMPTVPLRPDERGTLANALVHRYPDLRGIGYGPLEPGILYRLDNDTSGLVLVARSSAAFNAFAHQQERDEMKKHYLALARGRVALDMQEVTHSIAHDRTRPERMRLSRAGEEGRPARTLVRVLERFAAHTLVACAITRGVRHQIRVHLASLSHPIAGDLLYDPQAASRPFERHFLHCHEVTLRHPASFEAVTVAAPLTPDLERWLKIV